MRPLPQALSLRLSLLIAALGFASACSDLSAPNPGPAARPQAADEAKVAGRITVYTQNLYVGADVDAVIAALASGDQGATLNALAQAVATLGRTSFATRAAAIADEIARVRPDVVGFQEGSKIDVDLTALGAPIVAHEDFLATLKSALAARGLTGYVVADTVTNIKASLVAGLVSLIDYDVLLVNTERVAVGSTFKKNYAANDGPFAGIDLIRGFIGATIAVEGRRYVVVTTHTEGTDLTPLVDYHQLHALQMQEIVDRVSPLDLPTIVMGDLNDSDTSPMHQVMLSAGFADVWETLHPGVEGSTCCHLGDLSDPGPRLGLFDQRIDYVFARGFGGVGRDLNGKIERYGFLTADRVAGPEGTIWPSDHAGLVATLVSPPAQGPGR